VTAGLAVKLSGTRGAGLDWWPDPGGHPEAANVDVRPAGGPCLNSNVAPTLGCRSASPGSPSLARRTPYARSA